MTTKLMAFPFRIGSNGAVVTQIDGSDEYVAGQLAMLIQTRPGERILVPEYGMDDPAFDEMPFASLAVQIEKFGPFIKLEGVTTTVPIDGVAKIDVTYSMIDDDSIDTDYMLGG